MASSSPPSASSGGAGLSPCRGPADPGRLAELRARIGRIGSDGRLRGALESRSGDGPEDRGIVPLGVEPLDRAQPGGGLQRGGLHELLAADDAAAVGFAARLLARLAGAAGTVLWCRLPPGRGGCRLYGPGLAAFGLDPARLLIVYAVTESDLFWAMEEGLRSGAVAAVLGETTADRPVALRRLQLAAETHGTPALLLRSARTPRAATAGAGPALTRWRVGAVPAATIAAAFAATETASPQQPHADPVRPRWRVGLVRCRGSAVAGPAGTDGDAPDWLLDAQDNETGGFRVAADLRHRPAEPHRENGGRSSRGRCAGG